MAKTEKYFICNECGNKSKKWLGNCPQCNNWGTYEEEIEISSKSKLLDVNPKKEIKAIKLNDVLIEENFRYKTSLIEFDRVLGGGLVQGEVVLLTGKPGIGKSTLLLQVAKEYVDYGDVLYVLGEESPAQVKTRGVRLGVETDKLYLMPETKLEILYEYILLNRPKIVVIDSIQTLYSVELDSIAGTTSQIRECTLKIIELAKRYNISFFIVGHITKDGKVAGPKLLEHMVDAVLNFEGEEELYYRILRTEKNRFGSTNELAIFSMEETGIKEIKNASEFFLTDREEKNIGSIVTPTLEGSKVFLLELQSLVIDSSTGIPRRIVQGIDTNRIQLLSAIAEKKLQIALSAKDLFINIPGGLIAKERAIDLSIVISILSVIRNIQISQKIAAIGELGLRGEVRRVAFIEKRLKELEKLGFKGVYIPEGNRRELEGKKYNLKLIYLSNIEELLNGMGN